MDNSIKCVLMQIHPTLTLTNKAMELLISLLKKDFKPHLNGELKKHANYEIKKNIKPIFQLRSINQLETVQKSALVEYICVELLEASGNIARDKECDKIKSQDIIDCIKNDVELRYLFEKVQCNEFDLCDSDFNHNFKLTQYVMENDFKNDDEFTEELFEQYSSLCMRKNKKYRKDKFGLKEANMICEAIIKHKK